MVYGDILLLPTWQNTTWLDLCATYFCQHATYTCWHATWVACWHNLSCMEGSEVCHHSRVFKLLIIFEKAQTRIGLIFRIYSELVKFIFYDLKQWRRLFVEYNNVMNFWLRLLLLFTLIIHSNWIKNYQVRLISNTNM